MNDPVKRVNGSFRDPNGSVFTRDGGLYRSVEEGYKETYDHLMNSGLYDELVRRRILIPHEEVDPDIDSRTRCCRVLKPKKVDFVSYPYEWSFSQLKDAALATLEVQRHALDYGMSLKDASAYNMQFVDGKPCLIDTLSFEKYAEGKPWVAYRQFCQHFLAPLALMCRKDIRLSQLLRVHIDGIPLDMAGALLPARSWLASGLLIHVHLHSLSQRHYADKSMNVKIARSKFSLKSFMGLLGSLSACIEKLDWKVKRTAWADYYDRSVLSEEYVRNKEALVRRYVELVKPHSVWDLGSNTGLFSRIASDKGIQTISFDADPACVEANYLECKARNETHLLPLVLDVTNPSPAIGWENRERMSLMERGPADMILALALVHHLALGNNLPFDMLAGFFNALCTWLIIEFVPKDDPKAERLIGMRTDMFHAYSREEFENAFKSAFDIREAARVDGSERYLYLMKSTRGSKQQ